MSSPLERNGSPTQVDVEDQFQISEVRPRWLHVSWRVSEKTLARARSAFGREGHRRQRVLRVYRIDLEVDGPPRKTLLSQVEIPEACEEWFQRVPLPCRTCQVELGEISSADRFFSLFHSSPFELAPELAAYQPGAVLASTGGDRNLRGAPALTVQAAFNLSGGTDPRARVFIDDREVAVDSQSGHFDWQLPLTNGRVVVPVHVKLGHYTSLALLAVETNFHLLGEEPGTED